MMFLDGRIDRAQRRGRGDRDRDADAVAAPRARHGARGAGPGGGVPGGQGQPRPLQGEPRRACWRAARCGASSLDVTQDPDLVKLLQDIKARWERVDANAGRVLDNQQSLTSLAKGLEGINQGNNGMLELAQQAAQQVGPGRRQRCAKSSTRTSSPCCRSGSRRTPTRSPRSDEIDPEVAFLLGKDAGTTFREILNGLLKGSDALRLSALRNDEARATLAELQKRFAAYDGGVNAILQNMSRLVAAKQAARGVNAESEALLADTTQLAAEVRGRRRPRAFARWAAVVFGLLGTRLPAAARQGVPRRRPRPRLRERAARTSATRRRSSGC